MKTLIIALSICLGLGCIDLTGPNHECALQQAVARLQFGTPDTTQIEGPVGDPPSYFERWFYSAQRHPPDGLTLGFAWGGQLTRCITEEIPINLH